MFPSLKPILAEIILKVFYPIRYKNGFRYAQFIIAETLISLIDFNL
jgi:hypothetical protein